ncbi:hypothetical protein [Pedobacter sp. NJ-S-72]
MNEGINIYKIATNLSSQNYASADLLGKAKEVIQAAAAKGFDELLREQAAAWATKWEEGDIIIEGDVAAQQAIRFNIFQLNQTYTGKDARLNIGPKGFTREKNTEVLLTGIRKLIVFLFTYRLHHRKFLKTCWFTVINIWKKLLKMRGN